MAEETRLTPVGLSVGRSVRIDGWPARMCARRPERLMRVVPEFCLVGLVFRHLFHDRRNGALTMTGSVRRAGPDLGNGPGQRTPRTQSDERTPSARPRPQIRLECARQTAPPGTGRSWTNGGM
jgi:hypothetical protein